MQRHVLSVLVENEPGVLSRVAGFGVRRPIGALNGWGRKVAVMAERPLVGGGRRAYAERMPLFKAGRRWLLDRTG